MSSFLFVVFYAAMAGAALVVEFVFGALHLIPQERNLAIMEEAVSWNHTTWLNIAFLLVASLLVWRFMRTGGPELLRMMSLPMGTQEQHHHHH